MRVGLEPRAPSQDEGGWMLPLRVPFGRRRDTCVPPLEQRCDATEQRCVARFLCSGGAVPGGDGTASRFRRDESRVYSKREIQSLAHAALSRVRNIRSMVMKRVSKIVAALVFGLAGSALATPSLAQRAEGMSGARAQALEPCNKESGKFVEHTTAAAEIYTYRACMTKHAQQE